jgi:hypothetical protein
MTRKTLSGSTDFTNSIPSYNILDNRPFLTYSAKVFDLIPCFEDYRGAGPQELVCLSDSKSDASCLLLGMAFRMI